MQLQELKNKELEGKVWFLPTDTIPGISALASDAIAIQRIYELKKRDPKKPLITLCSSIEQIEELGIDIDTRRDFLESIWPGPVTVIFSETLSVRVPADEDIRALLAEIGPIVSTSCNKTGEPAIMDSQEAQRLFQDAIDYYVESSSEVTSSPSTIIKIIR